MLDPLVRAATADPAIAAAVAELRDDLDADPSVAWSLVQYTPSTGSSISVHVGLDHPDDDDWASVARAVLTTFADSRLDRTDRFMSVTDDATAPDPSTAPEPSDGTHDAVTIDSSTALDFLTPERGSVEIAAWRTIDALADSGTRLQLGYNLHEDDQLQRSYELSAPDVSTLPQVWDAMAAATVDLPGRTGWTAPGLRGVTDTPPRTVIDLLAALALVATPSLAMSSPRDDPGASIVDPSFAIDWDHASGMTSVDVFPQSIAAADRASDPAPNEVENAVLRAALHEAASRGSDPAQVTWVGADSTPTVGIGECPGTRSTDDDDVMLLADLARADPKLLTSGVVAGRCD